jgi:NAD(P)-dependent dehydrogenase (short-subunit alcohol dehydrogenase family)
LALATAKLFVEEGAYVFITGRRKDKLDEAVRTIGRNVTGVQGDASNLADLGRLYETVKKEKGNIDVLFASAGYGEFAKIGEATEEHFDETLPERSWHVVYGAEGTVTVRRWRVDLSESIDCEHQGFSRI